MATVSPAVCPPAASGLAAVCKTASRLETVDVLASGARKILAEYVWLAGVGVDLRSRTVVLSTKPGGVHDLPVAEVEATDEQGEVFLRPRKIFTDPLRGGDHLLVVCDAFVPPQFDTCQAVLEGCSTQLHPLNTRVACEEVMSHVADAVPEFAAIQEYCVLDPMTGLPYGVGPQVPATVYGSPAGRHCQGRQSHLNRGSMPGPAHGSYSVGLSCGSSRDAGCATAAQCGGPSLGLGTERSVVEAHMAACLNAGLKLACAQQLKAPGSWCYKIGPCDGLELGDQLWASRHLLLRVSESRGVAVSFAAPPLSPDAAAGPGGRCSIEFSTRASRDPASGMLTLQQHIARLQAHHPDHSCAYTNRAASDVLSIPSISGSGAISPGSAVHGAALATLPHEPGSLGGLLRVASCTNSLPSAKSSASTLTVGVGDRRAAVVIPSSTLLNKCGPIVDRRPPADMDPYASTMLLASGALGVPLPDTFLPSAAGRSSVSSLAGGDSDATGCKHDGAPVAPERRHEWPAAASLPLWRQAQAQAVAIAAGAAAAIPPAWPRPASAAWRFSPGAAAAAMPMQHGLSRGCSLAGSRRRRSCGPRASSGTTLLCSGSLTLSASSSLPGSTDGGSHCGDDEAVSGVSYSCGPSLNTEDVLISELDRRDQHGGAMPGRDRFAPETPPNHLDQGGLAASGSGCYDDTSSDGSSPLGPSPLADTCSLHGEEDDEMFYE